VSSASDRRLAPAQEMTGGTAAPGWVWAGTGGQAPRGQRPPLSVGIILAENFTLSALSLFVDHLRLAADEGDRSRPIHARWAVMSPHATPMRSSCGVPVGRTSKLIDPAQLDYIAVVGGILHPSRRNDPEIDAYLHAAARAGVKLIGICTGSFILCRAGLMEGRRTCVSWYHYQDFQDEFPEQTAVADRLFIEERNRITCAGGAGAADLAIHLIARHLSRSAAQKASQVMLFDRARAGTDVQPHPPMAEAVADPRIRRAMLLMEQNLADPLPIVRIAERLGLSTRQMERLFQAALGQRPAAFYRMLRLRYARWLIDNTERSVTDIALDAGFADCAHFSREFKKVHGFAPSDNRPRARRDRGSAATPAPQHPVQAAAPELAGMRVFG